MLEAKIDARLHAHPSLPLTCAHTQAACATWQAHEKKSREHSHQQLLTSHLASIISSLIDLKATTSKTAWAKTSLPNRFLSPQMLHCHVCLAQTNNLCKLKCGDSVCEHCAAKSRNRPCLQCQADCSTDKSTREGLLNRIAQLRKDNVQLEETISATTTAVEEMKDVPMQDVDRAAQPDSKLSVSESTSAPMEDILPDHRPNAGKKRKLQTPTNSTKSARARLADLPSVHAIASPGPLRRSAHYTHRLLWRQVVNKHARPILQADSSGDDELFTRDVIRFLQLPSLCPTILIIISVNSNDASAAF